MREPLITALITSHNYGRFIEEAIDSVLAQEFPEDRVEILVVDDGSTDDTAERIKKYGERIRYFCKPNGGQASALNFGLAKARGDIIALLDADDFWLPGKLRRVAEEFEKNPGVGMVYHAFLEFDMGTNERRKAQFRPVSGHYFGGQPEFFWYQSAGTPTSTAFRRKALEHVFPIPEEIRMCADGYIDFLLPFYSPVRAIPEYLAAYRLHGSNNFYADDQQMPREVRKSRWDTWEIFIAAMRKALAARGFSLEQPPVRPLLDRFVLRQQGDEFMLQTPGRWRYFRHLLLYNRCYGPHISLRLRFLNYVNAFGALVTGYKHFPLLDQWRERAVDSLRNLTNVARSPRRIGSSNRHET